MEVKTSWSSCELVLALNSLDWGGIWGLTFDPWVECLAQGDGGAAAVPEMWSGATRRINEEVTDSNDS